MVNQQEAHLGAVTVRVALLRRIYPANGRSCLLLQRRKCNSIKDSYPPATNANLLSGEKLPMPLPQCLRQLFTKGLVVDRLPRKDLLEGVVQWLTCCRLGKLAEKFTTRGRLCP